MRVGRDTYFGYKKGEHFETRLVDMFEFHGCIRFVLSLRQVFKKRRFYFVSPLHPDWARVFEYSGLPLSVSMLSSLACLHTAQVMVAIALLSDNHVH